MDYKVAGEVELRKIYATAPPPPLLHHRPSRGTLGLPRRGPHPPRLLPRRPPLGRNLPRRRRRVLRRGGDERDDTQHHRGIVRQEGVGEEREGVAGGGEDESVEARRRGELRGVVGGVVRG